MAKTVAVAVEAAHDCMPTRGVRKEGIIMMTMKTIGCYESNARLRAEFMASIRSSSLHGLNSVG